MAKKFTTSQPTVRPAPLAWPLRRPQRSGYSTSLLEEQVKSECVERWDRGSNPRQLVQCIEERESLDIRKKGYREAEAETVLRPLSDIAAQRKSQLQPQTGTRGASDLTD